MVTKNVSSYLEGFCDNFKLSSLENLLSVKPKLININKSRFEHAYGKF